MQCQNCHNTHAVTAAEPLVDPRDPSPANAWTGGRNDFCFRCHTAASLPTTSTWADAVLGQDATTTVTERFTEPNGPVSVSTGRSRDRAVRAA